MATRIYLDHAATTPVLREAREAMTRGLDAWANASSPHAEGRGARALDLLQREKARMKCAKPPGDLD